MMRDIRYQNHKHFSSLIKLTTKVSPIIILASRTFDKLERIPSDPRDVALALQTTRLAQETAAHFGAGSDIGRGEVHGRRGGNGGEEKRG